MSPLLHGFQNQSEEFVLGVEVGILFGRFEQEEPVVEGKFYSRNKAEVLRLAVNMGYRLIAKTADQHGSFRASWEKKK